jgi:hypothetical protein
LLDALFNLVSPTEPAIEQAWIAECEQRAAAIDSGAMTLLDADDVMMKYSPSGYESSEQRLPSHRPNIATASPRNE